MKVKLVDVELLIVAVAPPTVIVGLTKLPLLIVNVSPVRTPDVARLAPLASVVTRAPLKLGAVEVTGAVVGIGVGAAVGATVGAAVGVGTAVAAGAGVTAGPGVTAGRGVAVTTGAGIRDATGTGVAVGAGVGLADWRGTVFKSSGVVTVGIAHEARTRSDREDAHRCFVCMLSIYPFKCELISYFLPDSIVQIACGRLILNAKISSTRK